MEQIDQGIFTDIIFYEPISALHDSIEEYLDIMIDYIEDHRLKKYKERIGQYKPHLDRKINIMMAQIMQEFNED